MKKMPFKPPFKIALVYWKDAYVTTDDDPRLDHKEDLTISMGAIVKKDDKEITLSTFYDGISQNFSSPYHVIPVGMVRYIKEIEVK